MTDHRRRSIKRDMVFTEDNRKIAIFVSFSGSGGVERMVVNLSEGLVDRGFLVDLVLVKALSSHLDALSSKVNVVKLGSSHTMGSLPALVRYLRRQRPAALLAAKDRANQVAILARRLAGVETRIVVRMGTTASSALEGKSLFKHWLWYIPMRLLYPLADEIVAVSNGVATDLAKITGLPPMRIRVIANPVITQRLGMLAKEPLAHPWFIESKKPVILGAGRLTRQKDFPTLIKAFALMRTSYPCRLIILGGGKDRGVLEALATRLGVGDDFHMPGFVNNPYAFMSRASLFVLSSAWEGSPNVLTEALALGVPVVATDCPSGPGEILGGGLYGRLVPVGNEHALADAMLSTLVNPPDKTSLMNVVREYSVETSTRRYLETLLGGSPGY